MARRPTKRGSATEGERRSHYITPEGFERLRAEHDHLWNVERPRVTEAVSVAAAMGDRSENADYIYGKKRLREIDSRVRFLGKRIEELTVVKSIPDDRDKVFFGAWVTVEDDSGEERCYRIVGPDESDAATRAISMDSPIGRALLGREVGDEVEVRRPRGLVRLSLTEIVYEDASESS